MQPDMQPQQPAQPPVMPPQQPMMQQSVAPGAAGVNPTTHIIVSVVVMLLASLPFGIAGLIFALKSKSKLEMGDVEGAKGAAKTSLILNIVGAVLAVLAIIGFVLLMVIGAAAASTSS